PEVVPAGVTEHDYEANALNPAEQDRLLKELGSNNVLMQRNHGLLTVGKTDAEPFLFLSVYAAPCAVQTRTSQNSEQLVQEPSA
ncbi:class II aldolase, partial [Pseudoalteromonas sp. S4389]